MEYEPIDIFVDFYNYCPKCEYEDRYACDEPCNTCLESPVNEGSEKPVKFEGKDEK